MSGPIATAREGLTGVVEMLAGRTDFHHRFDVTSRGVLTSFMAAILAAPVWAFVVLVQGEIAARAAQTLEGGPAPFSLAYAIVRWAAIWTYFPLLATLITRILGRPDGFGPWVVVHNWTHLFIAAIQVVPLALVIVGAPELGSVLYTGTVLVMAYAYVCAARAGLTVGWALAILVASANLAAALLVDAGLREVL